MTYDTEVGGMTIRSLSPMTKEEVEQQLKMVSECPEISEDEE